VLLCSLLGLENSCFWSLRQDTCVINVIEEGAQHGYIIHSLYMGAVAGRVREATPPGRMWRRS
jgi:hypothetical protein